MNTDRQHPSRARSATRPSEDTALKHPRVVILEDGEKPRVEVLDLPEDADLGALFCHSGTDWRVTGLRTGNRVLIARPAHA